MKHVADLLLLLISFLVLTLVTNAKAATQGGASLKVEGTCSGTLNDGTPAGFTYYSDFDGCKNVSKSAITFTVGPEGLFTGKRAFSEGKDVYSFPQHKLSFPDSTGNTSGSLTYTDHNGERRTVELQCSVRDYEYAETC